MEAGALWLGQCYRGKFVWGKPLNPFDGLAKYLLGRLEQKIIQAWARLLFQMALSGFISFFLICGGALVGGASLKASVGSGMVIVALVETAFFRSSPLTKGMSLVLPAEEAQKELNTNFETITKPEDIKK